MLKRGDALEMARDAGLLFNETVGSQKARQLHKDRLIMFAGLVAEQVQGFEREACAKLVESDGGVTGVSHANMIRSRGGL